MAYNNVDEILEAVKVNLKYEATGDFDDPLTNMINAVLTQLEMYTNVSFTAVLDFETMQRLEGWADSLTIRYVPLVDVELFYQVGNSASPYIVGKDFFFMQETGIIYIPLGLNAGVYYIAGQYGYGSDSGALQLPTDIGFAAVMQTTFSWQKRDNLGKKAVQGNTSIGGVTYEDRWALLDGVKEILEKHVVK